MSLRTPTSRNASDSGITLVEVLIALVLSAVIVGVIITALLTSLNIASATTTQINDSSDTGLISSFLFRDAESSGGINPDSGLFDSNVGVSTIDWSGCTQGTAALVARFSWIEHTSATVSSKIVVTYGLAVDTKPHTGPDQFILTRQLCKDGVPGVSIVLGRHLESVTADCLPVTTPECDDHPISISLNVSGSGVRAPIDSVLKASLRTIASQLTISGPAALPAGQNTVAYTATTVISAASTGTSAWNATGLPPGLGINSATGIISGTPTTTGSYPLVVVTVTDALGRASRTYSITTSAPPPLTIDSPATLPNGQVGVPYPTTTVIRSGGVGPFVWTATGLPAGVTINSSTGVVSGTPTAAGTFASGVIKVTDSTTFVTKTYSITIAATLVVSAPATLPAGELGVAYPTTTMVRTGGTAPYTWSAVGLPAGVTINTSTGVISGTPTVAGAFTATVTVTDAFTSASKVYAASTINAALVITGPATLPNRQVGVAYTSTTMTRTGGTTPWTWSATGLPAGIVINSSTGVISGTATASGTFTPVIKLTDALTNVTKSYTITINAALVISAPATLPNGTTGTAYTSTTMVVTGGTAPYTWSATALPAGVTINSSTGVISGTPTTAGTVSPVVKVTDALTNVTKSYTVTIIKKTYYDTINETAGLVNYWRLGEASAGSATDTFTTGAGLTLQSHIGEGGTTWTKPVGTWADAIITASTGRIRKDGTNTGVALYYSPTVPASADYKVEADIYVTAVPLPTNDAIGVVGRLDPTASPSGNYYQAFYDYSSQKWTLAERTSTGFNWIGQSNVASLSVGTYRLTLDMVGSTIQLLINGVQQVSVVDTSITAAGRGGVVLGWNNQGTTDTDTAGMQLDNFSVSSASPALADSKGTNIGSYANSPLLGAAGALVGDANTAVTFDGINEYGSVARQIADDFSIEFWFKSTQGIGTGTTWTSGAGLVDSSISAIGADFGVSLRVDGKILAGVGGASDVTIVSTTGGYNNGAWHHVVFTRTKSSGALALYIDNVAKGTATGSTVSLSAAANINFGRILGSANNYYLGSMDEVAVYNTVLTTTIIAAHYVAAS